MPRERQKELKRRRKRRRERARDRRRLERLQAAQPPQVSEQNTSPEPLQTPADNGNQ